MDWLMLAKACYRFLSLLTVLTWGIILFLIAELLLFAMDVFITDPFLWPLLHPSW